MKTPALDFNLPTIPDALRFRIEQFEWTDRQFAAAIGMNQGHFSEVLSGKRRLPLDARLKAYALGVPAAVLLQPNTELSGDGAGKRARKPRPT